MASNGCRFAWEISALAPGSQFKARWHVYADTLEEIMQGASEVIALIRNGELPAKPAQWQPPSNGGNGHEEPTPCLQCGTPGTFVSGVSSKNGRSYKAFKCTNATCPQRGEFIKGTFRWLPQGATV
jgi:hypothetical protein